MATATSQAVEGEFHRSEGRGNNDGRLQSELRDYKTCNGKPVICNSLINCFKSV